VAVLARAQQTAMPMIGFLTALSEAETLYQMVPFRRGLSEGGFVEGQNVAIEYRFADGEYERLTSLAAEFTLLAAGWSAWSKARRVFARIYAQSGCHSHAGQSRSASRSGRQRRGEGGRAMDQSIPPFGDGENVTLMSTKVPHASMLQTSVHGCDAPVADVTGVANLRASASGPSPAY
jgi:hypothetical protein